jgi:phosphatidylglycerol:prolipoprotein diacylglycerol transferase
MLALGGIANCVDGVVYGGVSRIPWAVSFIGAEGYRHPVQIYEAACNAVAFGILFFIRSYAPRRGVLSGCFLLFYGGFRFIVEFYKDYYEYGYETLSLGSFNIAHLLCFIMVVCGVYVLFSVYRRQIRKAGSASGDAL